MFVYMCVATYSLVSTPSGNDRYRDEASHKAVEYYSKLPKECTAGTIFVVDPMCATGGTAIAVIDMLKEWAGDKKDVKIKMLCILSAPEGINLLREAHPDVTIYTAGLDDKLNENAYIIPGLGDAGDKIFGTK